MLSATPAKSPLFSIAPAVFIGLKCWCFARCTSFTDFAKFFLNLQKLTDIKTAPDQYLINNASAVVPIYLLLTESKKIPEIYRYKGTKSDFCREWNSNVASRIPDKDRSQALTIEYDSFKAECNRAPWKNSSPANWNRDKVDSKHKVKLDRAVNTKKHLERLFT